MTATPIFPNNGPSTTLGRIDKAIADLNDKLEQGGAGEAVDVTTIDFSKLTGTQVAALKTKLGL